MKRNTKKNSNLSLTITLVVVGVILTTGSAYALSGTLPRLNLAAAAASSLPTTTATAPTTATTPSYHSFSYLGLDKGAYGPEQDVSAQTSGGNITITVYSNQAEIARLVKYVNANSNGGAPAYLNYYIIPGVVKQGQAFRVEFDSPGETWMEPKNNNLVTTLTPDFTQYLLPTGYYTVLLDVRAADSSFNLSDYIYIKINNTAECVLKG